MNRRCLSVSIQRRGGADPPPTWEQLRGAGFQAHYYYNSTNGWFPRLSNTTYETELGDGPKNTVEVDLDSKLLIMKKSRIKTKLQREFPKTWAGISAVQ